MVGELHPSKVIKKGNSIDGEEFYALNGGPMFKFTEAVSFFINGKLRQAYDGH